MIDLSTYPFQDNPETYEQFIDRCIANYVYNMTKELFTEEELGGGND